MDRGNLIKPTPVRTELNVARLGLISIQQRLPQTIDRWEAGTLLDGQAGSITCQATEGMQVPHGIDGDVLSAIITLYQAQNSPSDRLIRTNIRELMRIAHVGQPDGKSYGMFKDSLARLNQTAYSLESAWKRRGIAGRLNAKFYLVESLTGWRRDVPLIPGREEEDLVIGLSPHLAQSAATGYLLSTQVDILRSLGSASARGQYRLFESLRTHPDDPQDLKSGLHLTLQDFSGYARLLGGAQDAYRVRRILQPALEQLHRCGYLKRYEVIGRGAGLSVMLEFSGTSAVTDQRSVKHLEELGVTSSVAQQLALSHHRREIEAVCWWAQHKAEQARKNSRLKPIESVPGLIVTMLRAGDGQKAIEAFEKRKTTRKAASPPPRAAPQPGEAAAPITPSIKTFRFLLQRVTWPEDLQKRLEQVYLRGKVTSEQIAELKRAPLEMVEEKIAQWEA